MSVMTRHARARAPKRPIILAALLSFGATLLFAACNSTSGAPPPVTTLCAASTVATRPASASSSLLLLWPTLQKSARVMLALSSAQFQFQGSATLAVSGTALRASASTIQAHLLGSGAASAALHEEYASARLSLQPSWGRAKTAAVSELLSGGKLSLQQRPGRQVTLELSRVASWLQAKVATMLSAQNLLAAASHIPADDRGLCLYAGQSVRHLTLWLDGAWLEQDTSTSDTATGMSVDLLLQQRTGLPLRIEVAGRLQFPLAPGSGQSSSAGSQPRMLQAAFWLDLSFGHFNQGIARFAAPAEATPAALPASLSR